MIHDGADLGMVVTLVFLLFAVVALIGVVATAGTPSAYPKAYRAKGGNRMEVRISWWRAREWLYLVDGVWCHEDGRRATQQSEWTRIAMQLAKRAEDQAKRRDRREAIERMKASKEQGGEVSLTPEPSPDS